ncbi:hypothetical protein [Aquisalibacillus elongatus]|uniref:Uncharacterized protein n=1 Tax=Aquisalibacillus elongatus TaxID=485577 RepID=A0A3N5C258_9BACI|nr:hypothetical protein [Aquisalibacillus elongatus]RPF52095.1 hypothetical protein EDC24_2085 [Aquisalibacillus elongatus]
MNTYSKDHIQNLCKSHMNQYVLIETNQGEQLQGVIVDLDDDHVYVVTPVIHNQDQRQFYPYSGYYGYPYYGYPQGPGVGLRRLILPLTAIAALSLLPWF